MPPPLSSSEAWFAKYDGIDGESQDADRDKWIDVLSIDWGAHKPGDGATGHRGDPRGQGHPQAGDRADGDLRRRPRHLPEVRAEEKVTSYDVGGTAEAGPPIVVVANNFEEVKVTYIEYESEGIPKGNVETTWKVATGER